MYRADCLLRLCQLQENKVTLVDETVIVCVEFKVNSTSAHTWTIEITVS